MPVLSDKKIHELIEAGYLNVSPIDDACIREHSISLHLGNEIFEIRDCPDKVVDVADMSTYPQLELLEPNSKKSAILKKGGIYLAPTKESIRLPDNICAYIDGTSDLARLGISVVLCGHVAPGFGGAAGASLILEISSQAVSYIRLYYGMRIANLVLYELSGECNASYSERIEAYSGQKLQASKLHYRVFKP